MRTGIDDGGGWACDAGPSHNCTGPSALMSYCHVKISNGETITPRPLRVHCCALETAWQGVAHKGPFIKLDSTIVLQHSQEETAHSPHHPLTFGCYVITQQRLFKNNFVTG